MPVPAPVPPPAASAKAVLVLQEGHVNVMLDLRWSPDGRLLASVDMHGIVKIWDGVTGTLRATLERGTSAEAMAWSPDGATLAVAGAGVIRLWDLGTASVRLERAGPPGPVMDLVWAADGRTLAAVSRGGRLGAWDAVTGDERATEILHDAPPQVDMGHLHWSPDGAAIANGGLGPWVTVWDASTGLRTLSVASGSSMFGLSWSPNSRTLAASGTDGVLRLFGAEDGALRFALAGHSGDITEAAWSPDGGRVASAGFDGTVRVWDAEKGVAIATYATFPARREGSWTVLGYSPSGAMIAASSEEAVALIRPGGGVQRLGLHDANRVRPVFDCAERSLGAIDRGAPVLWDLSTGARRGSAAGSASDVDVRLSDDGTTLVARRADGAAVVWDVAKMRQRAVLEGTAGTASRPSDERESYQLVLGGARVLGEASLATGRGYEVNSRLRLWSAKTGRLEATVTRTSAGIQLSWSPDGRFVGVTRSVYLSPSTGGVELFRVDGLVPLRTVDGGQRATSAVAWSPDDTKVAVLGEDLGDTLPRRQHGPAAVVIWEVATGKRAATIALGGFDGADTVTWSADGATLVTSGKEVPVGLWDAATGKLLRKLDAAPPALARAGGAPGITIEAGPVLRRADGASVAFRVLNVGGDQVLLAHTPEGAFDGGDAAARLVRFRIGDDLCTAPLVTDAELGGRFRHPGLVLDLLAGKAVTPRAP